MKIKQLFYWLGMKPPPREYGWEITDYYLPDYGEIQYANWLHPKMGKHQLSAEKIAVLRKILAPGDVAIDIGAHAGDTAIEMALAVGKTGTVFAFEPNRYVFKILAQNCRLNLDKTNIIPYPFAATDKEQELVFNYSDPGFCNGGEFKDVSRFNHAHLFPLSVSGKNIADLLLREHAEEMTRLRYIKIDAEGADFKVFQTLATLVRKTRPFVRSEINKHMLSKERREYWQYLLDLDYTVMLGDEKDGPSQTRLVLENLDQEKTFDIWAIPNSTR